MNEPYDHTYWKDGIQIWKWGNACARGLPYKVTGAPVAAGTKGVERKISTGRKHRGSAAADLERKEKRG